MSHQPRLKRRAPFAFEWEKVDAGSGYGRNEDGLPPTIRIKHTDFHLDTSGSASTQTTFVPAPASPEKVQRFAHTHDWDSMASVFDAPNQLGNGCDSGKAEDEEGDEEVDAQYQRHLDMQEPDVERTRRKRCVAVRVCYHRK